MRERQSIDPMLFLLIGGLVAFGLLTLLSASGPLGFQKFSDSWFFVKHQVLFGVIPGVVLFVLISKLNYKSFQGIASVGLILSIVLLILVYLPGIGREFGGSSRWVTLGPIRFQPSEFVKVTFVLYMATWLARRREKSRTVEEGLIPFLTALGIVGLLLLLQPNTGSLTVIAGSAVLMYLVSGAPFGWFAMMGGSAAVLLALLLKLTPYRAQRFMTFLHPELDPQGIGYHINQAFLAIGSGGLFGLGYGQSRQKYLYLPEVAGDSIFAVMSEELGFIVMTLFIAALALLVHRCFVIARQAPDEFGRYLATGVGSWIAIQSILNIGSMVGLLPMTGVTLPLVSYGSSAFIALAIALGLVASVSRQVRSSI